MERHFVLAMTIAAAAHGLLLGIPRGAIPSKGPRSVAPIGYEVRPAIPIVPAERDIENDTARTTSGAPDDVVRLPDKPILDDRALFRMPVEAESAARFPLEPMVAIRSNLFGNEGTEPGTGRAEITGARFLDRAPNARVKIAPDYPYAARHDGRNGTVMVEFVVDETGRVLDPRAIESTDPIFDDAALRAVAKWRFEPGTVRGRAVRFRMAVPIVFRVNSE